MRSSGFPRNISTTDQFEILPIKTCQLKVNIHCKGCKEKVKKILGKIEGVYSVDVNAEKQKVKVTGNVDSTTLINKLVKSGKYAEIWPSNQHPNQNQEISNFINNQNQFQNLITNPNIPKSQPLLTPGYPRNIADQMAFERYLKQSMDMNNNHAQMGWNDDRSVIGENNSGFIDFEGSQLGGFNGSFNGGIQNYHEHQSSMPMMNMYQLNHQPQMIMNRNFHNMNNIHGGMVHDDMYMHQPYMPNHALPMIHHANRANYY